MDEARRASDAGLLVRVLGPLEVAAGGSDVDLGGPVPRRLLHVLAASPRRPVPVARLVEEVWDGRAPDTASATLTSHVSRLRRALASAGVTDADGGPLLRRAGAAYRLDLPTGATDLEVLREERLRAREAREAGRAADARRHLRAALAAAPADLGQPLDDLPPSITALRTEAAQDRDAAARDLAALELDLGHHVEQVPVLERLVAADPAREDLAVLLATALYRCGRQADALEVLERCRQHLADALGLDPGPELREVQARVLAHDPHLAARPPSAEQATPVPAPHRLGDGSTTRHVRRVPGAISRLVGRPGEVEAVLTSLEDHRLVTLVGPGGTGKTRLAQEVATRMAGSTTAVWVPLVHLGQPHEVASEVARSLGIDPGAGMLGVVAAAQRLGGLLVVVDNAEHLVRATAEAVHGLLSGAADVRVLCTSRVALGVAGEHAVQVDPLGLESASRGEDGRTAAPAPAVELFVERARAAAPGWQPDDERAEVEAICRRLDGLPLALELAAARVRDLDCADILAGIGGDPAGAVAGGGAGLLRGAGLSAPHHTSMADAIGWSVALLEPGVRDLLLRLSVLDDDFDLSLAVAVGGEGTTAADVAALVEHHLLAVEQRRRPRRYRMLRVIREWAQAHGAGDVRTSALQGLGTWLDALAREVGPVARDLDLAPPAVARAQRELRHLLLACTPGPTAGLPAAQRLWLLTELSVAFLAGSARAALAPMAAAVLEMSRDPRPEERAVLARGCAVLADLCLPADDLELGVDAASRSLAIALEDGDGAAEVLARSTLALTQGRAGQLDLAAEQVAALPLPGPDLDALSAGWGLAPERADHAAAHVLNTHGQLALARGDLAAAHTALAQARERWERTRDWPLALVGSMLAGQTALVLGRPEEVIDSSAPMVTLAADLGLEPFLAVHVRLLAAALAALGETGTGLQLLGAAEEHERRHGVPGSLDRDFDRWAGALTRLAAEPAGQVQRARGAARDRAGLLALVEDVRRDRAARRLTPAG